MFSTAAEASETKSLPPLMSADFPSLGEKDDQRRLVAVTTQTVGEWQSVRSARTAIRQPLTRKCRQS